MLLQLEFGLGVCNVDLTGDDSIIQRRLHALQRSRSPMEPLLSRFIVQVAPRAKTTAGFTTSLHAIFPHTNGSQLCLRAFATSSLRPVQEREKPFDTQSAPDSSYSQPATNLSQDVTKAEKDHFERVEAESRTLQTRSPWMRDGSDVPPVARLRSAGAMTKGKLLTTPSRMLKLILPLTTRDANDDRKDVEPLALLVHPQQPLSYLERLIQSELPILGNEREGEKERPPKIAFRAQDNMDEDMGEEDAKDKETDKDVEQEEYELENAEETVVDGKLERTGKISGGKTGKSSSAPEPSQKPSENFPEDSSRPGFVRWSPSTEIGDFIRDAARAKEFAVDIEGAPEAIYVGVPSFDDRTYYLRMRLRKTAKRISELADLKQECDNLAHQGAKRIAQGGFMALIGWWGAVYYLTFKTDLGWDVMEPITYLVGLSGLISGYMWFLYHNREVSYRSAMNFTVSRRQSQLYEAKGFDLSRWELLMEEGNRLRREIKMVAEEYDVEWDETKEEGDDKVREALRTERKKKNTDDKEEKEKKEEDDD